MLATSAARQIEPTILKSPRRQNPQAVQDAIQQALHLTGYGELRRVQVGCDGDAVTITGRVPTYYLKQLAQNVALEIPGIDNFRNELQVC